MSEMYHEEMESSKDDLSEFKKETKQLKEKIDTVDNIDKWANKIFNKAEKIKADKHTAPEMYEDPDVYIRKRGNNTYKLEKSLYGPKLTIKETGKKERSVSFGMDQITGKTYIIAHDEQGKKYEDKAALNLAKRYVTQFKDALKIQN